LLRSLRQRVKGAGRQTRRNQEVAGALGRALREDRRFDFKKSLGVHHVADGFDDAVAEPEIGGHLGAAQIEVAVFQAQVLVGHARVDREGQHVGFVQHRKFRGHDLDRAGRQLHVLRARQARGDPAGHGNDVLAAQAVGLPGDGRVFVRTEDDLRDALAVAQVDENDAAVVAARIDPPAQDGFRTGIGRAQRAAVVSAKLHGWVWMESGNQEPE